MLNVPEEVKTLFKTDGVRKNFRVHFPNGELPDITNNNIVQESVKFTESLCSQDVLKFGLTEASVIEFETVGIPNMYGMTIECGIEIDLSSLTAAQISNIESGSWDGVYCSAANSDIGFAYFRVPYGIFRIESCPRDHQVMTHRKVQAYGSKITNGDSLSSQYEVLNTYTRYDSYKMNPKDIFAVCASGTNADALETLGYQETQISFTSRNISKVSFCTWFNLDGDTNKRVSLEVAAGVRKEVEFNGVEDGIIVVSFDEEEYSQINDFYAEMHEKYDSRSDDFTEASYYGMNYVFPHFVYGVWEYEGGSGTRTLDNIHDCYIYPKSGKAIAPFGRMPQNASAALVPTALLLTQDSTITINEVVYQGAYVVETIPHTFTVGPVTASKWDSSYDDGIRLQLEPTLKGYYYDTAELNSFANATSLTDIIQGYSELFAQFVWQNRFGDFTFVRINNANSISILPGMYMGFWWDEYVVFPIGKIKYSFGNDEVFIYEFGSGSSTYDMTDNPILKKMADASVSRINALLDEYFIPYLAPIAFTPVDLSMKGLPYLESGDYLAITADDGTIAYSFDMRQTISGVQVLTADVESTSGQIIESGES